MSNYRDFAPWAASTASGGGKLIQIREDNKTAQIPYKLFGGQTKSFHCLSPQGTVIEYSENGDDWEYLTIGKQSRFFDATDGLYLNGSVMRYQNSPYMITSTADILPNPVSLTNVRGAFYMPNGDYIVKLDNATTDYYKYNTVTGVFEGWRDTSTWISTTSTLNVGFSYRYDTDELVTCNATGSSVLYHPTTGTTTGVNNPINTAGTFNIVGITFIGGDLVIADATSGNVIRFDGKTDTIKDTVALGIVASDSIAVDKSGDLIKFNATGGSGTLYVYDGFSSTIKYSATSGGFPGYDDQVYLSVNPISGGICTIYNNTGDSGTFLFSKFDYGSSTVNQPAILLSESE